ncbi:MULTISPECIES: NAD(P)-dependent oxidoreductase [Arthrobacter]|jgi:putative NADH-flavin reductase|uniref:NAD(P)-dependent oxidoreductase n=1 Tax=Arthrobacter sp. UNC362MFTsu5.1 TaxID=1449044 RepID=UPI00048964BD|nr:NAD(P)H-binding protein [Arthrobacter sp. UNC362MFTsu5.1]
MKIAVYGATGMVGGQIVKESLRRGHEVTAISRTGAALPGATACSAELADTRMFASIASDHDAVVLATVPSRTGGDHGEWLAAMKAAFGSAGATRLLVVGGAGALQINGVRLCDSPEFPEPYRPEARTMAAAYDEIRSAPESLDWTMLAPAPVMQPGIRSGKYVTADDSPAGRSITTQDFAVAMLDELENPSHHRARFTVANTDANAVGEPGYPVS